MVISNSEDILEEKEGSEYLDEFGMMEGEHEEED